MLKSVDSSETVQYSVGLYLNGFKDSDRTAKVIFSTIAEKEKYIREEFKYCRKEEDLYNLARYKNQRDRTKDELLAKRVEFAKFSGYMPERRNPSRFVYVGIKHDPQVA